MKQVYLFAFSILATFLALSAQSTHVQKYPSFSIEAAGGLATSFMYKTPVVFTLCFEGCEPYHQDFFTGKSYSFSFVAATNGRHQILAGFSYLEIGIKEELIDGFGGGVIDNVQKWQVIAYEINHRLTILNGEKFRAYWENGPVLDQMLVPVNDNIKRTAIAFVTKIGLEQDLTAKLSARGYAFFKTALMKYNKDDAYAFTHHNYYPYSYGLLLGLSFRI